MMLKLALRREAGSHCFACQPRLVVPPSRQSTTPVGVWKCVDETYSFLCRGAGKALLRCLVDQFFQLQMTDPGRPVFMPTNKIRIHVSHMPAGLRCLLSAFAEISSGYPGTKVVLPFCHRPQIGPFIRAYRRNFLAAFGSVQIKLQFRSSSTHYQHLELGRPWSSALTDAQANRFRH